MVDSSSEQCCTNPVPETKEVYSPRGEYISISGERVGDLDSSKLPVYVAGSATVNPEKALVCIYDIFGLHPNTLRGADLLAQRLSIQVFVPDFFRGEGWDIDDMPPRNGRENMQKYIANIGSWTIVKHDLMHLISWFHDAGRVAVGAYGFCFGGKKLVQVASEVPNLFRAMAWIHPTNLEKTDGEVCNVPLALLPSGGEDPEVMDAVWETITKKSFGGKCVRKNFLDCKHGFASARSDWDDSTSRARVLEVYQVLEEFFRVNV